MPGVATQTRIVPRDDGTVDEFREYLRVYHDISEEDIETFAAVGITIKKCPCGCGRWQLATPRTVL